MKFLMGMDEYSGSSRRVSVDVDSGHIKLAVEATSGSNEGVALLTPAQARAISAELENIAKLTEAQTYLMDSVTGHRA